MHEDFRYVPESEYEQTKRKVAGDVKPARSAQQEANELARRAASLAWQQMRSVLSTCRHHRRLFSACRYRALYMGLMQFSANFLLWARPAHRIADNTDCGAAE